MRVKQSTKDQVKGKIGELKGRAKEKLGRATNDRCLEERGRDEKLGGRVRRKVGEIKKVFGK